MYLIRQDLIVLTNLFLGAEVDDFMQLLSERNENFKSICILNLHKLWLAYRFSYLTHVQGRRQY